MPVDPGPSRWLLPDPRRAPNGQDLVAVGGGLDPSTLLAGYRRGLFAMQDRDRLCWFSPDPRAVLPLDRFRVSRSLRRSSGRFTVSLDQAFDTVVKYCADPSRPGAWITRRYATTYAALHRLGWAHSVEVWQGAELAGGVFGIEIGGLFCGESMFHRATDASKIALWATVAAMAGRGSTDRVFDVQWSTPHLASLGVIEVSRAHYLGMLPAALAAQPDLRPIPPLPARDFLSLTAG